MLQCIQSVLKKVSALFLIFFYLYVICSPSYADDVPEGFYAYTLENGLELYVQEDFTVPAMSFTYACKAGWQRQNKENAGFFELYSRLFWQSSVSDEFSYARAGANALSSRCAQLQSVYSFTAAAQTFALATAVLAANLKHPSFSDNAVRTEFNTLKTEIKAWAESPAGFINDTVNTQLFSRFPWKKSFGADPAVFADNNIEQIRQKLLYISRTWYVPEQSALFISGPVAAHIVLDTVKKEFSDWERGYTQGKVGAFADTKTQNTPNVQAKPSRSGRFVLVSKDFSSDFIQAAIQYTAPQPGADSTYAAAAWAAAEILQAKLAALQLNNVSASFIADGAESRLSVQALFEARTITKKTGPAGPVQNLSDTLNKAMQYITENDLNAAKEKAVLVRSQVFGGTENFIETLCEQWAYGGTEYFFSWQQNVRNLGIEQIKAVFAEPWTFMLIDPDLHKIYAKKLSQNAWQTLTKDNGTWYAKQIKKVQKKKQSAAKTASNADSLQTDETVINEQKAHRIIEQYAEYTKSLLKTHSLPSGIPLTLQEIPNSAWTVCILNISGGELKHDCAQKGLEAVALQNLAKVIEEKFILLYTRSALTYMPKIDTETGLTSSSLSIVCTAQDTETVVQTLCTSLQAHDILISQADELYLAQTYNQKMQRASLDYQLYAQAMKTVFGGTAAEDFFAESTHFSANVGYEEIRHACVSLFENAQIGFILCGAFPKNIHESIKTWLTNLPVAQANGGQKAEPPVPVLSPGEQTVRLRHVFLTDIPAEFAGPRPSKLIPTSDFSDPAHVYFKSPASGSAEEPVFAALLYELAERLTEYFQNQKTSAAQSAEAISGTGKYPVSSLRFSKVKSKDGIKKALAQCAAQLQSELQNPLLNDTNENTAKTSKNSAALLVRTIKNRYTGIASASMQTLLSRARLIAQGIEDNGNPALYIDRLSSLEQADEQQMASVFQKYFVLPDFFWVFSADTKD